MTMTCGERNETLNKVLRFQMITDVAHTWSKTGMVDVQRPDADYIGAATRHRRWAMTGRRIMAAPADPIENKAP